MNIIDFLIEVVLFFAFLAIVFVLAFLAIVIFNLLIFTISRRKESLNRFHIQFSSVVAFAGDLQNKDMKTVMSMTKWLNSLSFLVLIALAGLAHFDFLDDRLAFVLFIIATMILFTYSSLNISTAISDARVCQELRYRFESIPYIGYKKMEEGTAPDKYPNISIFSAAWYLQLLGAAIGPIVVYFVTWQIYAIFDYLPFPFWIFKSVSTSDLELIFYVFAVLSIANAVIPFFLITHLKRTKFNILIPNLLLTAAVYFLERILEEALDGLLPVPLWPVTFFISMSFAFVPSRPSARTHNLCSNNECEFSNKEIRHKLIEDEYGNRTLCPYCKKRIRCTACGAPWDVDWGIKLCPICGNDPETPGDCFHCDPDTYQRNLREELGELDLVSPGTENGR